MNEIMIYGDYLCNLCINIMEKMSNMSGISYGTINILLFVILGPISTFIFMTNSFIQPLCKNLISKKLTIFNIILCILRFVLVLCIILPILYVFIFGKF